MLSVATLKDILETARIRRREHFRTLSILCFPAPGVLASEVLAPIEPKLIALRKSLPPGYQLQIGGEKAKQVDGFTNLAVVLLISLVGIYLALLIQFNNAVKPLLVFAAAPYGAIGALIALAIMGTPFGFMAFLGVASLIGVIVSHVIVLFDFIEEMHEKGEPLERALPDAGIERIRPVIVTVAATILALFPLALEGALETLCYAQIGGLAVATFITLLLVPSSIPSLYWISSGSNGKRQETGSRRLRQSQQCDDKRARVFLQENGVDLRLTGKIALVRGSTAGIGFAIAKSLASEGAHVYVNGRTQERVDVAVAAIRSHAAAAKVDGIAADFSGLVGAEAVIAKLPAVDVLVNNVGIFEPKPFAEIPDADWYRLFEINVMSGVRLSRHYLAGMLERNWGRILFISSESGVQIPAEMVHYGMTKTAQIAVARGSLNR